MYFLCQAFDTGSGAVGVKVLATNGQGSSAKTFSLFFFVLGFNQENMLGLHLAYSCGNFIS